MLAFVPKAPKFEFPAKRPLGALGTFGGRDPKPHSWGTTSPKDLQSPFHPRERTLFFPKNHSIMYYYIGAQFHPLSQSPFHLEHPESIWPDTVSNYTSQGVTRSRFCLPPEGQEELNLLLLVLLLVGIISFFFHIWSLDISLTSNKPHLRFS